MHIAAWNVHRGHYCVIFPTVYHYAIIFAPECTIILDINEVCDWINRNIH